MHAAQFKNPRYDHLYRKHYSRAIHCAEELPGHIALPRGCLDEIRQLTDMLGIEAAKAGAQVEFGCELLLCETREKFVADYALLEPGKGADKALEGCVQRMEQWTCKSRGSKQ